MAAEANHNEAKEVAPSTDSDQATDIPSGNASDPKAANPAVNPDAAGEKSSTVDDSAQVPKGDKPPGKGAKKEKAPTVEDKPFAEFIQQDYLPALKTALTKQGVQDLELNFAKQKIQIAGVNQSEESWQILGRWQGGRRQFYLYFPEEDIQGQRAFSCAEGNKPSTLEPFLIDERKITLDLLVFGVVQRLNAQKWLARN